MRTQFKKGLSSVFNLKCHDRIYVFKVGMHFKRDHYGSYTCLLSSKYVRVKYRFCSFILLSLVFQNWNTKSVSNRSDGSWTAVKRRAAGSCCWNNWENSWPLRVGPLLKICWSYASSMPTFAPSLPALTVTTTVIAGSVKRRGSALMLFHLSSATAFPACRIPARATVVLHPCMFISSGHTNNTYSFSRRNFFKLLVCSCA